MQLSRDVDLVQVQVFAHRGDRSDEESRQMGGNLVLADRQREPMTVGEIVARYFCLARSAL